MDHVMDHIREYMQHSVKDLKEEHESGKYNKLSECSSYNEVKAYCDSHNVLINYYYAEEYRKRALINPSSMVKGW